LNEFIQLVLVVLFVVLMMAGVWFGICMHEDNPDKFMMVIAYCCMVLSIVMGICLVCLTLFGLVMFVPAVFFLYCALHFADKE
jgi:hypothetical protein